MRPLLPTQQHREALMNSDLRRSPRVSFVAAAQVIEPETEVHLRARTTDISEHGCYLDMVNPLPAGTAVRLEIVHGNQTFDATGAVVYSQTPLGMGVEFREIPSNRRTLLEQWMNDPERLLA
jgi:PilZ domain-containing protein